MTRPGAAARKRLRAGEPDVKPRKVSWIHGSKQVFFAAFKDDFIKASELGKVLAGKFYDEITHKYLEKYGYNLGYEDDLRDGQDVASDVDEDEDVDALAPEESEKRSAYFDEIRGVSDASRKF
jgi:hypothetical protein